jgi:isocitrate dehydrogenase
MSTWPTRSLSARAAARLAGSLGMADGALLAGDGCVEASGGAGAARPHPADRVSAATSTSVVNLDVTDT